MTVLAAGIAVGGCGGGDSPKTVSAFCAQKAVKECGTKGSGGVADKCVVDADRDCKPVRMAVCMAWASEFQQAGNTRPFNPSKTEDCLARTGDAYKKSPIVPAELQVVREVCDRVFSGDKKKGDLCENSLECGGALVCDLVCADKTILAKGAFCGAAPGGVCGPGLYCATPAGQPLKMCVDRQGMGQPCGTDQPCLDNLRCLSGTSTCGARLEIAESCTSNDDCAMSAPYCDSFVGSKCDTGFIPSPGTPECTTFGAVAN